MPHPLTDAWQIVQRSLATLLPLQIQDDNYTHSETDRDGCDRIQQYVRESHTRATELHTDFMHIACFDWHRQHPNVPMDTEEVRRNWHTLYGTTVFNYDDVIAYLDHTFLPDATHRAYLALRDRARTLLPHPYTHPLLPLSKKHLLLNGSIKASTLTLQCYLERHYHPPTHMRLPFGMHASVIALWQFAKVALHQADPAHVAISSALSHYLNYSKDNVTAHVWTIPPITLRFFKKGRLDVGFTSVTEADTFLTALLTENVPAHTAAS